MAGKPPGAKDLVKACLTVDPTKRATAQTVLAHPWINGNAPDIAIDIGNLRKFQAARKLKAVRMRLRLRLRLQPAKVPGRSQAQGGAHEIEIESESEIEIEIASPPQAQGGAHPRPRPAPGPASKCSPRRASLFPTGGGEDHGDEVGGHRQPREGSARGGAGQVMAPRRALACRVALAAEQAK